MIEEEIEFSKKSDEQFEAQQTINNSKIKNEETGAEISTSNKENEEHNKIVSNSDLPDLEV